jgi:hypothetical protein
MGGDVIFLNFSILLLLCLETQTHLTYIMLHTYNGIALHKQHTHDKINKEKYIDNIKRKKMHIFYKIH